MKKTRSQLKREAILDAAKRAFLEYGVHGTSMDKLAALASVSKRTVYNHFSNKEQLVLHLLSELWTQSMVDVDVDYNPKAGLREQLLHLVEAEINLVSGTEFLGLSRAAAGYYLFNEEKLQDAMTEFPTDSTALHRWINAAMADGKLRSADIDVAFNQLHSLVKGVCYWPQLLGYEAGLSKEEKTRLASESVDLFLAYYQVNK
ncbi:MAG: TetR/AcrR family transcriptional regulator [Pseudomonadota bacterium]